MRLDSRTVGTFLLVGLAIYLLSRLVSGGSLLGGLNLGQLVYIAIAFLIAIDVHEFGHAFVADRLGDRTPRSQGRVTLNPIRHLDPFGTLMILMTFVGGIGIGWGKPVQVNPSRIANGRQGMALVSVAGVIANLATAIVAAIILRTGLLTLLSSASVPIETLLVAIVQINVLLAVFNFLVPLPPLDGFNFLVNVLPMRWSWQLRQIERFGPIILLLVVLGSQMGILFFNPLQYLVYDPSIWLRGVLLGVA
ncbi:MAG TPA: site-2 protease family protein [Chloroflexota bacterium]